MSEVGRRDRQGRADGGEVHAGVLGLSGEGGEGGVGRGEGDLALVAKDEFEGLVAGRLGLAEDVRELPVARDDKTAKAYLHGGAPPGKMVWRRLPHREATGEGRA